MNTAAFLKLMDDRGVSKAKLKKKLGIKDGTTLNTKIEGKRGFKQEEIKVMIDMFRLTPEEVQFLFFS